MYQIYSVQPSAPTKDQAAYQELNKDEPEDK